MKLLFVVPFFYDDNSKALSKVKTGEAIIVQEICQSFSDNVIVDILVTARPAHSVKLDYANVLNTSVIKLLREFELRDFRLFSFRKSLKENIKSVMQQLIVKKAGEYLRSGCYDLVHVHGLNEVNLEMIRKCEKGGFKCLATLHFYVGKNYLFDDKQYTLLSERERELIEDTSIPITVVSSGLKRKILTDYGNCVPDRITVISNGTKLVHKINDKKSKGQLLVKSEEKKVFLCIGTIQKRKNQIQLLMALKKLVPEIRTQIRVLFIGTDRLNGSLQHKITEEHLEDVAVYIGTVEHQALDDYYERAFAVISTSLDEAFGLTFIEGFTHGLPAVFFNSLDAVDELYSPDAVELISGKDDSDIGLFSKSW